MVISTLDTAGVYMLAGSLHQLAEYHNSVSKHFNGAYPNKAIHETLREIEEKIEKGISVVYCINDNGKIAGFSQCSIENGAGVIEYLFVSAEYRGQGCGKLLMDKDMAYFKSNEIKKIHIKIVHGNESAKGFYARYGFQVQSEILFSG